MRFSYIARAAGGAEVEGFVDAAGEQAAVRQLAGDGLRVLDLKPADAAAQRSKRKPKPVAADALEQPLSELSILLSGGVKSHTACESVARTAENPSAAWCFQVITDRLRIGESFADSFAYAAPKAPPAIKAIIRAGDTSGAIADAVKEAAETLAFQGGLRRDMISALIYPVILLLAGIGAAIFMTMTVIPKFASSIGERVHQLPAFTQGVFAVSLWLEHNAPVVAVVGGGLLAVLVNAVQSKTFRAGLADFAVSAPLLKGFMLSFESARWAGLFAAMIGRRTPLMEALGIAREGFASGRLRRQMLQAERSVKRGEAIAASMQAHTSLPPTLINLIAAGESSGDLAGAARSAALVFQDRARTMGKRLAALIEPLTVLIIGGFIGALAVTMLTAITGVTSAGL
jgi:general secretion pathway protein F